jgi:hypothetical protein
MPHSSIRERRLVAYHEAGHAVVAVVRAGRTGDIGVRVDGTGYANCRLRKRIRTDHRIEVSLAGALAAMRVRRISEIDAFLDAGVKGDWMSAEQNAAELAADFDCDSLMILADAMANAQRILADYWPAVERLAHAVLVSGSLTGAQVTKLVGIDRANARRYSCSLPERYSRLPERQAHYIRLRQAVRNSAWY